ncbi:MAG TPA: SLBB domain-containing protein, partial [Panacibacter sp.]|nr:SLBB domain-containing protein [Panacibacter sp.]
AITRPGEFELSDGLTLKGLIQKADGLRKDAFLKRGIITRVKDNLNIEVVSFDPGGINDGSQPDILLKKEDVITISSIKDLQDRFTFSVQGEVRNPGLYEFKDSTSIKDIIFTAGGFTEAATAKRIEIARRVTDADISNTSTEIAKIIQVNTEKDLSVTGGDFYLHPFDVVIVRNNPGYYTQRTVIVQGEIMYPGPYIINSNDEKLSDIIERAGGFKNTADPSAASLRRLNLLDAQSEIKVQKIEKLAISQNSGDTSSADSLAKEVVKPYDLIGINLEEVMKTPGITNDLILENGDVVFIPKKNQAVKVRGEVLFPTQFAFQENRNMKYYIEKAGGFASTAVKRKTFVLGANGNARKVKSFLFIKKYPEIYGGDEIFIPKKPDRKGSGLSTAEVIGISTAVASLASVVIALLNINK